jgi:peptide/nickel transport system substrate-binding protein
MRKPALLFMLVCLVLGGISISAQEPRTFVDASPADPSTFNTVTWVAAVDSYAQGLIFPTLSTSNLETGEPEPFLAEWEISEDGLTYTFSIREDAVWSDGVPITSTDVAFTLNAMFQTGVETFRTISGLDSINVIDDKHFEIVLTAPTCGLFSQIGIGIMPAHKFAADYSDFMTSPFNTNPDVSGGPFILTERAADEFLRFEANDSFFLGRPQIDQYIMKIIVDPDVRIQALQSGEADMAAGLTSDQIVPFLDNPAFVLNPREANGFRVALFNLADPDQPMPGYDESGNRVEQAPHPILGDPQVRKALIMGWNHDDGVLITGAGARRLVGPVAPILTEAYNNDLELYPYDPEAAAALLDEAGWVLNGDVREKDGAPLALEIVYIAGFEDYPPVMADYWTDLGADVTLTTGEQGVIINEYVASQAFDVFIIQVAWDEPVPDVLLNFLWNGANDIGTNFSSFVNEEFDGILAELATASCDVATRQPLYYRLQEIVHEEAATDFISSVVDYVVTSSRVSNAEFSAWGFKPWEWTVSD